MDRSIPEELKNRKEWFDSYVEALEVRSTRADPEDGPYRCPCCGHKTLDARGDFDICPVCFWEDDGQDDHDADTIRGGPNGALSLTQARQNFAEFGACERKFVDKVRKPRNDEL